jgi:carbon-monoxide dehydrogenase medium subunit/putative selenate reductase FAD-binding subunit
LYGDAALVVDPVRLGLSGVHIVDGELRIGANVTLQTLVEHDALRAVAGGVLADAAWWSTTSALRAAATVAGALTAQEGPAELRAVLLALDAHLAIQGGHRRDLPLAIWPGLERGELIVEVRVPAGSGAVALERIARAPRDEAILVVAVGRAGPDLIVAAGQDTGRVRVWRFGTDDPDPIADQVRAELDVSDDLRGSAEYRRAMAGVLVSRGLARVGAGW